MTLHGHARRLVDAICKLIVNISTTLVKSCSESSAKTAQDTRLNSFETLGHWFSSGSELRAENSNRAELSLQDCLWYRLDVCCQSFKTALE